MGSSGVIGNSQRLIGCCSEWHRAGGEVGPVVPC